MTDRLHSKTLYIKGRLLRNTALLADTKGKEGDVNVIVLERVSLIVVC